jgi:hypothetical protein
MSNTPPVSLATERLAASREALRKRLRAAPSSAAPSANAAAGLLRDWWQAHPAQVAGSLAADAAKQALQPVAQKHPWALVLGALVCGGVLAWSRPWHWALKPAMRSAVVAGLLPQLWDKALPYLAQAAEHGFAHRSASGGER